MAKQPVETRDRFKIWAEVEAASLGPLLAQLARMGLQNLGYELITDVVTFNRNGVKSREFASAWIADHPTFMISELTNHFKENGRTPTACYAIVLRLVEEGALIKLDKGNYQRADVKAIAAPEKKQHGGARVHYDVGNRDLIWQHIKKHPKFTAHDLNRLFREHGRPVASMYSQLSKMTAEKLVKLIGDGKYQVLKKGLKNAPSEKTVKPKPVSFADLNGSGAHATEQQHGS